MLKFFKKKEIIESKKDVGNSATCPICGGKVIENGDYYACVNILSDNCRFKCLSTFDGKKFDICEIDDFIEAKKNGKIESNPFVKMAEMESKLEKAGLKNAKVLAKDCANCDGDLCYNEDKVVCLGCDYEISTIYRGVHFTAEQMDDLLRRRISEQYSFEGVNGRVLIEGTKDFKLTSKYIFVTDISKLKKMYLDHYSVPSSRSSRFTPVRFMIQQKNK